MSLKMISQILNLAFVTTVVQLATAKTFSGVPGFGRNLIVRSLPPIPDFQSNLYEVYMDPIFFDPTRPPIQALAVISGEGEAVGGELVLSQWAPGGPVMIQGNVTGLTPGMHGLHVTRAGDLRMGCRSTGRHLNPYQSRHGGPRDPVRHLGDLGNIRVGEDGVAQIRVVDPLISLTGPRSVMGRGLVISAAEDDLGRAASEESAANGSSGEPVACGVVAFLALGEQPEVNP